MLLRAENVDINTIALWLGHESTKSTEIYLLQPVPLGDGLPLPVNGPSGNRPAAACRARSTLARITAFSVGFTAPSRAAASTSSIALTSPRDTSSA